MLTRAQVEQLKPLCDPVCKPKPYPAMVRCGDGWVGAYSALNMMIDTDALLRTELDKHTGLGTPAARFSALMAELEQRFPDPKPFDSSQPPECHYLREIDAMRAERDNGYAKAAGMAAAVGLAMTCVPDMVVDSIRPHNTMREVVTRFEEHRAERERLTHELEQMKSTMASEYEMDMNDVLRKNRDLTAQLAAMTQERDQLAKQWHDVATHDGDLKERP